MIQYAKRLGLLALTLTSLSVPGFAAIEVQGEFLYLRPSVGNTTYAIVDDRQDPEAPFGPTKRIRPAFEPAFRIAAGYLECCNKYDLVVTYTRLHQTRRSSVTAAGLWPTFGRPGNVDQQLENATASSRIHFGYDAVDWQVGHRSLHDPGTLHLRAWAGLHYANISEKRDAEYAGLSGTGDEVLFIVHSRSKVWGVGPKLGIDMRFELCGRFGFSGAFAVGLLAGDQLRRFDESDTLNPDTTVPTQLRFGNRLGFFTQIDARLGVSYSWRCSCLVLLAEIGYEFIDYLSALETVNFTGAFSTFNILCRDARLDGLYVSLRVDF